jgi:uncharacterized RDD family membrane protein YckC
MAPHPSTICLDKIKLMDKKYQLASRGQRFVAGAIDLLLIPMVLGFIIGLFFLFFLPYQYDIQTIVQVLANAVWLTVRDRVFAPGRMFFQLKLVKLDGSRPSVGTSILRNIHLMIPLVQYIGYIMEIISLVVTGERVADKWAKTKVVSINTESEKGNLVESVNRAFSGFLNRISADVEHRKKSKTD